MLYQGFYYLNDFFVNILLGFIWSFVMLNLLNMRFVSRKKLRTFDIVKKQIYKTHFIIFLKEITILVYIMYFFFQLIQILASFCIEFYNGVNQ